MINQSTTKQGFNPVSSGLQDDYGFMALHYVAGPGSGKDRIVGQGWDRNGDWDPIDPIEWHMGYEISDSCGDN